MSARLLLFWFSLFVLGYSVGWIRRNKHLFEREDEPRLIDIPKMDLIAVAFLFGLFALSVSLIPR